MKPIAQILVATHLVLAVTVIAAGPAAAGPKPVGSVKSVSGLDLGSSR
ncbi:MAG: hypothetical protein R3D57_09715 [Hyphomicrobiaceae bacterium]